jgi:hypothetical protein
MYHGAALTQIAEDERFTAINAFKDRDEVSRSAFHINDDMAVYLKYATKPTPTHDEYVFLFNVQHLEELSRISALVPRLAKSDELVLQATYQDSNVHDGCHSIFDKFVGDKCP